MEYLVFGVTRTEIQLVKKVEAIIKIMPPKNKKQVSSFIGLVKYYSDMWARRPHLLQPLTELMSKKVKFKWTDVEQ